MRKTAIFWVFLMVATCLAPKIARSQSAESIVPDSTYADIQADPGYHDYSIRVVYDDLPIYQGDYYAMSCMETTAVTVGVDENEGGQVSVYPNPVNDELTIKAADMTHIRIVNALGQIVDDTELKADETRIPMQRFGSGVYVIHITTANGTFARRVVVYGM